MSYLNHPAYTQSKIINALRAAIGGWITVNELIEIVYAGCKEPEYPDNSIRNTIFKLKKKGYPIIADSNRGYRFAPTITSKELVKN